MNGRTAVSTLVAGLIGTAAFGEAESAGNRFEPPVAITVNGQVFESSDRLAAPALGDFFDAGRRDLLVGQERGRMRVFRNVGTQGRPEFASPVWFDELMPEGRIPTG